MATWLWIIAIKISDKFLNSKKKTLNHASLPFKKWRLKPQKKENYIHYNIFLEIVFKTSSIPLEIPTRACDNFTLHLRGII